MIRRAPKATNNRKEMASKEQAQVEDPFWFYFACQAGSDDKTHLKPFVATVHQTETCQVLERLGKIKLRRVRNLEDNRQAHRKEGQAIEEKHANEVIGKKMRHRSQVALTLLNSPVRPPRSIRLPAAAPHR